MRDYRRCLARSKNVACCLCLASGLLTFVFAPQALAQPRKATKTAAAVFPPALPGGKLVVTEQSDDFLKPPDSLAANVAIAKTAPTVDFLYYPGQDYAGNPWSNWGDSLAVNGKYYASIGNHLALGGKNTGEHGSGTAFVYEYDPAQKTFRQLADVAKTLALPAGHYTPGKIHGRLDLGSDGWIYFSTHRGSTTVTSDANHYLGDWIMRCDPKSASSEVVAQAPVPKHCIPCSVLDPQRMIFYGGTAPGSASDDAGIQFFAYDVKNRRRLYAGADGPARYMIFASSTGCIYYTPGKEGAIVPLVKFDPSHIAAPVKIDATLGLRAATQETPQGRVYTVSSGSKTSAAEIFEFNTKTERVENLGPAAVGVNNYITSIDADPTGRFLYYVPGAHGGSEKDGSAVVQFDVHKKSRKVIAFLHPHFKDKFGATLSGTFSSAIDPQGDKLYITWNINRTGGKVWDCCGLTVIHIPTSERQ